MRGQIVGFNGLQRFEFRAGFFVTVVLIIGDTQFAPGVNRLGILLDYLLKSAISASEFPARRSTNPI